MTNYLKDNKIIFNLLKIYIFAFPLILFFTLELLNPGTSDLNLNLFGLNLVRSPYNEVMSNFAAIAYFMVLTYSIIILLFAIFGNLFVSTFIVSLLFYLLYLASYLRKVISGWVLSPGDLSMAKNLDKVLSFTTIPIDKRIIITSILFILILVVFFFAQKKLKIKLTLRKRSIVFGITAFAYLIIFATPYSQALMYKAIGADYSIFKTSNNHLYKNYGVGLGFFIATQEHSVEYIYSNILSDQPKNAQAGDKAPLYKIGDSDFKDLYNAEYMKKVMDNIDISTTTSTDYPVEKPNVIVIMSEAFTDPTLWSNIAFSDNPTANLHQLQQTSTHANIVTPAFGGNTCNPEFEFLTGSSMYFTAPGDIPFEMPKTYFPSDDVRALPQIFKNNGYKTIGLHTNDRTFFNRDTIYPKLGFDKFLGLEDMADDPPFKGIWPSDEFFTDQIIEQFEAADEPLFLYGISMQNHFQYYKGKYEELDIYCTSDNLSLAQTDWTNAYLQGIYDADKQLGRLVDYLEKSDEPTIVYFFGDHLPIIGYDTAPYGVFKALGYVGSNEYTEWGLDDQYNMHTTPYVLWANYELPEHDWQDMSPYFIGPLLLDVAGLQKNTYFEFLNGAYSDFHALKNNLYVDNDNAYYSTPLLDDKETLDTFYYLNYDYLFGEKYSADQQVAPR